MEFLAVPQAVAVTPNLISTPQAKNASDLFCSQALDAAHPWYFSLRQFLTKIGIDNVLHRSHRPFIITSEGKLVRVPKRVKNVRAKDPVQEVMRRIETNLEETNRGRGNYLLGFKLTLQL